MRKTATSLPTKNDAGYFMLFYGTQPKLKDTAIKLDVKDSKGRMYRQELVDGAVKNSAEGTFVTAYTYPHPTTKKDVTNSPMPSILKGGIGLLSQECILMVLKSILKHKAKKSIQMSVQC